MVAWGFTFERAASTTLLVKIPKAIGWRLSGVKEDTPSPRQPLLRGPGWSEADLLREKKKLTSGDGGRVAAEGSREGPWS